jgi:arylsulfatase B
VHVNMLNLGPETWNPADPVSGFAAIPRNMTGIAAKLKSAGYKTHQVGKWDAGMGTVDHTPHGRGYDTSFGYFHHDNDYCTPSPLGPLLSPLSPLSPAKLTAGFSHREPARC